MGNLTLNGATSGQLTLAPPAVAGTNTLTLPAQTATVLTDSSGVLNIGSGQVYKDASGNVGIGTSSPSAKFMVTAADSASATNQMIVSGGRNLGGGVYGSAGSILFTNSYWSGGYGAASITGIDSGSSGGYLGFATTSNSSGPTGTPTERARIDSSGNLLVGTTSTLAGGKLVVDGGAATAASIRVNGGYSACYVYNQANGNYNPFIFSVNNNATQVGSIACSTSTTSFNTSSDYRLKENVKLMTTGLATISQLNPVTYDWISDKSQGEGFIAHELQDVIPLAVSGEKDAVDEDGNIKPQGVDYSKIVVHLVAAMQEQQATINALTARITALEAK